MSPVVQPSSSLTPQQADNTELSAPASPDNFREEEARRIAEAQEVFRREIEALEVAQSEYEDNAASQARDLLRGARSNLEQSIQNAEESGGFFSWVSGASEAMQQTIDADREMFEQRQRQVEDIESTQAEVRRLQDEAQKLNEEGNTEAALEMLQRAHEALGDEHTIDTSAYSRALSDANQTFNDADHTLGNYETVARGARTAAVAVSTTAVVIAAAPVVGAAAAVGAGVAAGMTLATGTNVIEQAGHVALGNKTVDGALRDGVEQLVEDSILVTTTAASAVVAAPIAGKIAGQGAGVISTVVRGGITGAVQSVGTTTLDAGERTLVGQNAPTAGQFAESLVKNGLAGFVGGVVGARGGLSRGASAVKNASITIAEGAADATTSVVIEGADAAIDGREFSLGDAVAIAAQTVPGTLLGEASRRTRAAEAAPGGAPIDDDEPVILKFPDPEDQTAPEGGSIPLAMAAGAESLTSDPVGPVLRVHDPDVPASRRQRSPESEEVDADHVVPEVELNEHMETVVPVPALDAGLTGYNNLMNLTGGRVYIGTSEEPFIIPIGQLRFTHDEINPHFGNIKDPGPSIWRLVNNLLTHPDYATTHLDPLRVVQIGPSDYISLDNRRLAAHVLASMPEVRVRWASVAEVDNELLWRFTSTSQGLWATLRGSGQDIVIPRE